jgi:hypothetical protein
MGVITMKYHQWTPTVDVIEDQLDEMRSGIENFILAIDEKYGEIINIDHFNGGPTAAIRYCESVIKKVRDVTKQVRELEKCFNELDNMTHEHYRFER